MVDDIGKAVLEALISAFLAFEHSSDGQIEPGTAVRAMEHMSLPLISMGLESQRALRGQMIQISMEAEDAAYGEFVRELPDSIGLAV